MARMSLRTSLTLRVLGAVVVAGAITAGPAVADVDTTPPVITVTAPAEGQVIASNQGAVPTAFSCVDEQGGSGVATCQGDATIDTTKHGDQTFTVQTSDNAGNATTKTVNYRIVDMIPPQITITSPTPGQHVPLHSTLPSTFNCTDEGGSLIDTCSGTQIIESPEPGPHQFTVLAIDGDGNRVTKSVPYVVDATEAGNGNHGTGGNGTDVSTAASAGLKASTSAVKALRRKASAKLSFSAPAGSHVSVRVKRGGTTVANGSAVASASGSVSLTLRRGKAARKLLAGRRKLTLHVFVTVTDAQGHAGSRDKAVVVR